MRSWLSKLLAFISFKLSPAKSGFFLFIFISSFFLSSCDFFSNRILTKPVVEVGDYRMTMQDFSKALAGKLKNLDALSAKDPQIISKFKEKIISDFVVESLISLWFDEQKLTINQDDLEKELKDLQAGYPDDKSFRLALSEESVPYSQWRRRVETGLKRKVAFKHMNQNISLPSDEELQSYYNNNKDRYQQKESVQLSHILVMDENQADIVKKLTKTQKFADIIKKFSMSPDAAFGGNYGWIDQDANEELEKLFKSRVGDIIGPVKLQDGYHLFKVEQRRSRRQKTFEEVKDQAKNDVIALRQTAKFSAWLDEQIKRYKILKNAQAIDALYIETQDGKSQ
ncbi:MAG: peptidyl-prolyl cis-trans isomerase [Bdellovibrio sp.]|nr:peptidyl-prolyl cis-trans isomerase [Bdellovibrio sp.]